MSRALQKTEIGDRIVRFFRSGNNWLVAGIVGIITACTGAGIEILTRTLNTFRLGYCRDIDFFTLRFMADCTQSRPDWTAWSCFIPCWFKSGFDQTSFSFQDCVRQCPSPEVLFNIHNIGTHGLSYFFSWMTYIMVPMLYGLIAVVIVNTVAPAARGSGIPEVKTILGGFVLPGVLSPTTLTKVLKIVKNSSKFMTVQFNFY
jgi:chloride channel 3/4/5